MSVREVDIHTLPGMLSTLRLPSFHKLWAEIATRADTEGLSNVSALGTD